MKFYEASLLEEEVSERGAEYILSRCQHPLSVEGGGVKLRNWTKKRKWIMIAAAKQQRQQQKNNGCNNRPVDNAAMIMMPFRVTGEKGTAR